MKSQRKICGTCKWNCFEVEGHGRRRHIEFYCRNEGSVNYGAPNLYDDSCEDWEEKGSYGADEPVN